MLGRGKWMEQAHKGEVQQGQVHPSGFQLPVGDEAWAGGKEEVLGKSRLGPCLDFFGEVRTCAGASEHSQTFQKLFY